MSDTIKEFEGFTETFKQYQDGKTYEEMENYTISFESKKDLTAESLIDPELIIKQISEVSKRQFYYNNIYESQKRVLQELEDEFELWFAKKYMEIDSETTTIMDKNLVSTTVPVKRNEAQKENAIKVKYETEYKKFKDMIRQEKYKLGLVSGVKKSLESFSFKLSNINEYARHIED